VSVPPTRFRIRGADGYDAHIDGLTGFVVFVGPVGVWLRLVLNHVLNGPRFDAIRGPL